MHRKYENLKKVPLFGKYTDPFGERAAKGNTRPKKALPVAEPSFKRTFEEGKVYVSWLGHSSVFIHMAGKNILIDPVFSTYTSPVPFVGPRRFAGRVVKPEELPVIDLVLITHSHYDHLDRATIVSLDKQVRRYVVPEGTGKLLRSFGVKAGKIRELYWYEECGWKDLRIILTPSQHDTGRGPWDMNRSLWGGFVLKDDKYTVFDSGDGGYAEHFQEIRKRYGDVDLAIMECGQYNEKWHAIHMFPEESVQAAADLNATVAIPVHWGAYVLSNHAWNDPPKRFVKRAKETGVNYKVAKMNAWVEIVKE